MSLTDGGIQPTMPVQPANNYGGGMGKFAKDMVHTLSLIHI